MSAGLSRTALRLRRHREEMEVAIVDGLSLEEARERLRSYQAHLPRLAAPIEGSIAQPQPAEPARPVHWWQREDL